MGLIQFWRLHRREHPGATCSSEFDFLSSGKDVAGSDADGTPMRARSARARPCRREPLAGVVAFQLLQFAWLPDGYVQPSGAMQLSQMPRWQSRSRSAVFTTGGSGSDGGSCALSRRAPDCLLAAGKPSWLGSLPYPDNQKTDKRSRRARILLVPTAVRRDGAVPGF